MKSKDEIESNFQLQKGKNAYNSGEYREAIECFEEALKTINDQYIYYNLALCYSNLKDHVKALDKYNESYNKLDKKINKEYFIVLDSIIKEEKALGNYENAMKLADKALKMIIESGNIFEKYKSWFDTHKKEIVDLQTHPEKRQYEENFNHAETMKENKSYNEAIELYTKCLNIKDDINCYLKRANCYKEIGMYEDAINDYDEAIKHYNSNINENYKSKCFYEKGLCHLELCHFESAEEMFKKAWSCYCIEYGFKEKIQERYKVTQNMKKVYSDLTIFSYMKK